MGNDVKISMKLCSVQSQSISIIGCWRLLIVYDECMKPNVEYALRFFSFWKISSENMRV